MIYLHNFSQLGFVQVAGIVPFQCLPDFKAGAMTACSDGLHALKDLWTIKGRVEEQQEVRMIFLEESYPKWRMEMFTILVKMAPTYS